MQRADDALSQPIEKFTIGDGPGTGRFAFVGINEDEVDVRRDIEFAATQLAHADGDELLRQSVIRAERLPVLPGQQPRMQLHRRFEGHLGELRHGAADLGQRSQSRQVAHERVQKQAPAQIAQCDRVRLRVVLRVDVGQRPADVVPGKRPGPRFGEKVRESGLHGKRAIRITAERQRVRDVHELP